MATTLRAALALTLLVGYYVLAALFIALPFASAALMLIEFRVQLVQLTIGSAVVAVAVGGALLRASRTRPPAPEGLLLTRQEQPHLWGMIDHLAARLGTRPPDDLYLIPEVNAAVSEDTRWLGLSARRRHMFVGLPLIETLSIAQLQAVLCHELGHFGGSHTRLSGIVYRGAIALGHTVDGLEGAKLVRKVFTGYANLYFMISNAVRRRQEIEADRSMVTVSGRDAAGTALRAVVVIDVAWSFFVGRYIKTGGRFGLAPDDLFAGFHQLLAEPSRREEMSVAVKAAEAAETERHDSHPPLGERLGSIARTPEPAGIHPDHRGASLLVVDLPGLRARVAREIADGEPHPWEEYLALAFTKDAQEDAANLIAAAERVTGTRSLDLAGVLAALEAGRGPDIARELIGDHPGVAPGELAQAQVSVLRGHLAALVSAALLAGGRVRPRPSWAGAPLRFMAGDQEIDVAASIADPPMPGDVPRMREMLSSLGAAPGFRPEPPERNSVSLIGVLHGVSVDSDFYDVLVLDAGLLFVGISIGAAMRGGMSGAPLRERTERMLARTPGELLEEDGNWVLAAETVVDVAWWWHKDKWKAVLTVDWTSDAGPRRDLVRVEGDPPCTSPQETEQALRALYGTRVRPVADKP
ncbi:MAG: M48 family metalloprotease [Streptosporangiales bacterium]|nr:M48 family metalloprotease [Streptosporangiales bacterium]